MTIDKPAATQKDELRQLWIEAFGDEDAFLDAFYGTAYSEDRCRCIVIEGQIAAALYWMPCEHMGQKIAYIYGVATAKAHRGKGLCHTLMADTHRILKEQGYEGTVLVPQQPGLEALYGSMGYRGCCQIREFVCGPEISDLQLSRINAAEYANMRRRLLPDGGVIQEGVNLDFLAAQARFYAGHGFVLAARVEKDVLHGIELLGNTTVAPALVALLGCAEGKFRTPGDGKPFAMYRALGGSSLPAPAYFGLAFD